MRVDPFEPRHLVGARVHPKQWQFQFLFENGTIGTFGEAWSAFDADDLICVGGLLDIIQPPRPWQMETAAWLLFTDHIKPGSFVGVYRELARRLAGLDERVLVHIDPDYPEAGRMAVALGFKRDGVEQFNGGRSMVRMVS